MFDGIDVVNVVVVAVVVVDNDIFSLDWNNFLFQIIFIRENKKNQTGWNNYLEQFLLSFLITGSS